ncbi:MAG: SDR family oxidoreductase, partial [Chloroflexota bacterium]
MPKNVFITGATSGIGLEVATQLNQAGWRVFATGLQEDDFSVLDASIEKIPLDLADEDSIEGVVKFLKAEAGGKLDAVVNNAAINLTAPLESLTKHQLWKQFDVNVFGQLYMIQATLPLLRQTENPRIVNVSSLMGQVAMPLMGAYSMSKHAFNAMTDTLRLELAQEGIHVSLVTLGAIDTPMTQNIATEMQNVYKELDAKARDQYFDMFDSMILALKEQADNATPVRSAAKAVVSAVTSHTPKARYAVGTSIQALIALKNIMPSAIFESILKRS